LVGLDLANQEKAQSSRFQDSERNCGLSSRNGVLKQLECTNNVCLARPVVPVVYSLSELLVYTIRRTPLSLRSILPARSRKSARCRLQFRDATARRRLQQTRLAGTPCRRMRVVRVLLVVHSLTRRRAHRARGLLSPLARVYSGRSCGTRRNMNMPHQRRAAFDGGLKSKSSFRDPTAPTDSLSPQERTIPARSL
jgi:hypothetical protein